MDRFDAIINADVQENSDTDIAAKKRKMDADFEKVRSFLDKKIMEMNSILRTLRKYVRVKVDNYNFSIGDAGLEYTRTNWSTSYFENVIKATNAWERDMVIKTMEAFPEIRKEFNHIFDKECDRLQKLAAKTE